MGGKEGEGLKGMADLECHKHNGLQRPAQCLLIVMTWDPEANIIVNNSQRWKKFNIKTSYCPASTCIIRPNDRSYAEGVNIFILTQN